MSLTLSRSRVRATPTHVKQILSLCLLLVACSEDRAPNIPFTDLLPPLAVALLDSVRAHACFSFLRLQLQGCLLAEGNDCSWHL